MTIKQFQELYYIAQLKDSEIDKSIKMVGVVTGLTPEKVEDMRMDKFNKICAGITQRFEIFNKDLLKGKPKNFVAVNGRKYRINYQVDKQPINAGKYVEGITFGKDTVENLHKIMATICTPVNWRGKAYELPHEVIATDMESMDFEDAYHAAVFFLTLYSASMNAIQPYLMKEMKAKGIKEEEALMTLNGLQMALGGFITPKWSQNLKLYLLNRFGT